jgi:hypothetical protein
MKVLKKSNYVDPDQIDQVINLLPSFDNLKKFLIKVTDEDDSPDLTEIHPRDRTNLNLFYIPIYDPLEQATEYEEIFKKSTDLIKAMPGIKRADYIAIRPNTFMPLHVDNAELPPYSEIDWYSVYVGVKVPSEDPNIVGVKINDDIYKHAVNHAIVFDTQIPHCAWNYSDEWWLAIKFYIKKEFFNT